MSEQLALNIYQFLAWSFICVVCGMFFGAGVYAFLCHWLESRGYKAQDHDAQQQEYDDLFGTGTVVEAGTLRIQ